MLQKWNVEKDKNIGQNSVLVIPNNITALKISSNQE